MTHQFKVGQRVGTVVKVNRVTIRVAMNSPHDTVSGGKAYFLPVGV